MRAVIMTFLLLLTSRAVADCGNLCNEEWWKTAVISDVNDELHAGVNVMARNTEGSTPLHSASMYGTDEMIQLLLNAGADIAARNECDSTPLHSAASNGPPENIQALLDGGADIMAQEADGWTPLHRAAACFECSSKNILVLMAAGASVMIKDEEGMSPWDYANANKMLRGTSGYFALKEAQFK
jgi:ankyrin repeat protein